MARLISRLLFLATIGALLGNACLVMAQAPAPPVNEKEKSKADFWIETGVMKVISPDLNTGETFTDPRSVIEILANGKLPEKKPNFTYKGNDPAKDKVDKGETLKEMAKSVVFRRNIWNLEFSFKPVRLIDVELPQPNGKFQRKQLYYLVYRVKNNGYHLGFKADEDAWKHTTYSEQRVNQPIYFFPHFVLQAHAPTMKARQDSYVTKEYLDRVVPAAMKPIMERERIGETLYDSVSITKVAIPVSEKADRSIWGVAIWEDVDPNTDYYSIFVQGLTNAFKFENPQGAFKAGDAPGTGRKFTTKTLQINFHRTGDADLRHEGELYYGLPLERDPLRQQEVLKLYGVPTPIDHQWIYR